MKCYWMLQNALVTAFTVSELLKESQLPPHLPKIRVYGYMFKSTCKAAEINIVESFALQEL